MKAMNNSKYIFWIGFERCLYEHERNNTINTDLQTLKLEERIFKNPKQETSKNFKMELISHKNAGRRIPA
jgi:hypothetical protein